EPRGGMSRTRARPEAAPGQRHGAALVARLVQYEILVQRTLAVVLSRITFVQVAPFVKQVRAEAGALDRLEKLLRDDLVGVDVGTIQRRHQAFFNSVLLHDLFLARACYRS